MIPRFKHLVVTAAALVLTLSTAPSWAAPVRPQMEITGYLISADLDPAANKLTAVVTVTLTALEDLNAVTFELNNGLQITRLTDAANKVLTPERLTTNSTVRVPLVTPVPKGSSTTFHFEYNGVLTGSDTSPVEGIKLAAIADPISILLYAGRWFPMTGLFTDRFTAETHIRVPAGERVIGSGETGHKTLPDKRVEYSFSWKKPGFRGPLSRGSFWNR